jgi:hypothetical protein
MPRSIRRAASANKSAWHILPYQYGNLVRRIVAFGLTSLLPFRHESSDSRTALRARPRT